MKVFIHIGTEKTGTTSIQNFFDLNRANLKDLGIAYLRSIGHTNNRKLATYCIGLDRTDDAIAALEIETKEKRQKWQKRILSEFRAEVNALPSNIHTIIISSEHFHSRLICKQELESLRKVISEVTENIEIIVFIRPQVEMAISLYSTALKVGQYNINILSKDNLINSIYYNYQKLLTLWADVFGYNNVNVRIFDKKVLLNGNVVEDLLVNVLGIVNTKESLVPVIKQNESILPVGQKILNSTNKHFRSQKTIKLKLRQYIENKYSGRGIYPTKNEYLQFQDQFQESNQQVAQQWFGRDELFKINYPVDREPKPITYSEEQIDDLICFFSTLSQ